MITIESGKNIYIYLTTWIHVKCFWNNECPAALNGTPGKILYYNIIKKYKTNLN